MIRTCLFFSYRNKWNDRMKCQTRFNWYYLLKCNCKRIKIIAKYRFPILFLSHRFHFRKREQKIKSATSSETSHYVGIMYSEMNTVYFVWHVFSCVVKHIPAIDNNCADRNNTMRERTKPFNCACVCVWKSDAFISVFYF